MYLKSLNISYQRKIGLLLKIFAKMENYTNYFNTDIECAKINACWEAHIQVYLLGVVCPRPKGKVALLFIKWEVAHINLTR